MMERIEGLTDGVVAVAAHGKVTSSDYENVLVPAIEEALKSHGKIRFLYHLGPDFTRFSAGAILDDARLGVRRRKSFDKCAVVTDGRMLSAAVRAFRFLMPCPVRVFRQSELAKAKEWVIA